MNEEQFNLLNSLHACETFLKRTFNSLWSLSAHFPEVKNMFFAAKTIPNCNWILITLWFEILIISHVLLFLQILLIFKFTRTFLFVFCNSPENLMLIRACKLTCHIPVDMSWHFRVCTAHFHQITRSHRGINEIILHSFHVTWTG